MDSTEYAPPRRSAASDDLKGRGTLAKVSHGWTGDRVILADVGWTPVESPMKLHLTENASKVLEARYLRRDPAGHAVETPEELFRRVARSIAQAEQGFGGTAATSEWEEAFFEALTALDFLPNSPTLMNAGMPLGQLSACFVLPVEDSMEGIFDSLKLMAMIQQSGGGTGFAFSRLRPTGDLVTSTGGTASGPVSFMRIFDCATENIRMGGRRRGANMGVLRVDHPDILDFIHAKEDGESFRNFNLSVAVTDAFMETATAGRSFELHHPRTGQAVAVIDAAELLERIARAAWRTGDPGLLFLDAINRANPTPELGTIEATNPCGEVPLLPFESCNLASINLARMLRRDEAGESIDWEQLGTTARLVIRFLDDVLEVGRWPDPRITAMSRANRKVGLGIMGFAELLMRLGIPYAAERAVTLADELMRFLDEQTLAASEELARERGVFPNWERSVHRDRGVRVRNATRTSIAPTGTLSIIAGTSPSIEPLFGLAYRRQALDGQTLLEWNPLAQRYVAEHGLDIPAIERELQTRGSLAHVAGVSQEAKELFQTALEIPPEAHLAIQEAFQRHVDNAVSKTVNLPHSATPEEVATIYRSAWERGLKGITIYRYGSLGQQVLELGLEETGQEREHFMRCDPHSCKL